MGKVELSQEISNLPSQQCKENQSSKELTESSVSFFPFAESSFPSTSNDPNKS
ncbi:hypothetical protein SESBI_15089 [Sesbania bispinosa]|nr:hypothetical protein SESBI_15089 [Sesbania bispinosa]